MLPDRVNFKGLNSIMVWVAVLSFGNHMGLDVLHDDRFLLVLLLQSLGEHGLILWNNSLDQVIVSMLRVQNVIVEVILE